MQILREINDLTLLLLGYRLSMTSIMSHIYMGTLQMILNDESLKRQKGSSFLFHFSTLTKIPPHCLALSL